MLKRLIILFLFSPVLTFAQLTDDFEDADISNWTESTVGRWAASDISPLSGFYSLHHIFDNPAGDHDQVSFDIPILDLNADITTWRFKIKYDYNPSDGNNWNVFLVSDVDAGLMIPGEDVNGYVLGVNYTGYDDILKLLKITSGEADIVITTSLNWDLNTEPSDTIALEITRSSTGLWEVLYNDRGDFGSLTSIGTGTDNTYTKANYFGVYYEYTSSADRLLWFDDIEIIGEIYMDNDPPVVDNYQIISSTELFIEFNEDIDSVKAVNILNYSIDGRIGNPDSIYLNDNKNSINVFLSQSLSNSQYYGIAIQNIEDLEGNAIIDTTINFLYFVPEQFDIVINEIMADPSPVVSLPNIEYLEIYNTSEFDINISGWTIEMGTTSRLLPSLIVNSNEYYIICEDDDEDNFISFGNVITVNGSINLTNSEQNVAIRNESGEMISGVIYTENWYQDDYKMEGGWSLEQIDPLNPCGNENNWIASESETGGTPGQENSVYASNPDFNSPELVRISVIDENSIQLYFNETLDSLSAMQTDIFTVDQSIGNPISIQFTNMDYKSLILEFTNSFSPNIIYVLEINGGIIDCVGNEIDDKNSARFAIPVLPDENDLAINEILFNPLPDGSDFIEIYNCSEKILDLKDLRIGSFNDETGEYSGIEHITNEGFLIFQGDYLVLTENSDFIKEQYYTSNPDGFINMDLPSFNDDEGMVLLLDKSLNIIDKIAYDEDMHFPLLATDEGVSLERINYNRPSDDKTNWHSASQLVGFATPAYENSQFMELEDIEDAVSIEPETFSPDNDGFDDVANISFTFDEPGYVANIKIYDSKGRLIKYLANNLLLGIDGVITWDGLDEKNQKAPVGIYVIYIEIFDLEGNVKQYKKAVVLAAKW